MLNYELFLQTYRTIIPKFRIKRTLLSILRSITNQKQRGGGKGFKSIEFAGGGRF